MRTVVARRNNGIEWMSYLPEFVANRVVFNAPGVVDHYANATSLTEVEQELFSSFIPGNSDILDLGVGGGRTTPFLSTVARSYVGVDYSEPMILRCRERFPELEFHVLDASDLSRFSDGSFDVVVFSFNGIDYIYPYAARLSCLKEVLRVLRPGGIFIFSGHNSRCISILPSLAGADVGRKVWRILRSAALTAVRVPALLFQSAFYSGSGYVNDPVHGGLHTYVSTPELVEEELAASSFQLLKVVSDEPPRSAAPLLSRWFYYVARAEKSGGHAG
jgi:SAM-dependent methyltransferase